MSWSSSSKKHRYPLCQLVSTTAAVISTRATSYHTSTAAFAMSSSILESPSAERNKRPIYDQVLSSKVFPRIVDDATNNNKDTVKILELAAGCGVHTTHFVSEYLSANKDLGMEWHPSDPDEEARASIDARVIQAKLEKSVVPANSWILGKSGGTACNDPNRDKGDSGASNSGHDGDVDDYKQHHNYFDAALCINMIHISPWEATLGLMQCAGKCLRKGGLLICYGPYKVGGTAVESNLRFDESLRSRNSQWGVRNLEDVIDAANKEGMSFVEKIEMPANNLSVLFCKD